MKKTNNLLIESAIRKAYLNEADTAATKQKKDIALDRACDSIIADIRKKLMDLKDKLEDFQVRQDSKPMKQLLRMYEILANEFDPVSSKLKEYTVPETQVAAETMVAETRTYKF
jgi:hypothetical protein